MAGDPKQTFVIDMTDHVSGPAGSAADALEKLKRKIQEDTAALRDLQAAQGRLKGSTVDVAQQKKMLGERIQSLKNNIASSQGQFLKMGGNLKDLTAKTKETGGSLAQASEGLQGMSASIGKVAGIVGIAVMVIGTLYRAGSAMISFALASYDAARNARITAEAFTGSAQSAENLGLHVASLSRRLPQTRAELMGIAQGLSESGLAGNLLTTALRAVSTASAVLPNAGAKVKAIAEAAVRTKRLMIGMFDLQGTGLTITDVAGQLAKSLKVGIDQAKAALMQGRVAIGAGLDALDKAVQAKFGKLAGQKAIGLEAQLAKFKELLGTLFAKLNLEPILNAFRDFVAMLDETTSTGQAIRGLFNTLFGGVGGSVKSVAGIVRGFIEGLIVGATLIRIAYLYVKIALKKAIPPELRPNVDLVNAAMYAGVVVVGLMTAAILTLAASIAGPLLVAFGPIIGIGLIVYGVYTLVKRFGNGIKNAISSAASWISSKVTAAFDAIMSIDLVSTGLDIIAGLATGLLEGIVSLPGKLAEGVANIGSAIKDGLATALGIHSPSRVGIEIGQNFTGAVGLGMNQKRDELEATANQIFPTMSGSDEGRKVAASAPPAAAPIHIQASFTGMAAQDQQWFEAGLERVLYKVLNGAGVVPAAATA